MREYTAGPAVKGGKGRCRTGEEGGGCGKDTREGKEGSGDGRGKGGTVLVGEREEEDGRGRRRRERELEGLGEGEKAGQGGINSRGGVRSEERRG